MSLHAHACRACGRAVYHAPDCRILTYAGKGRPPSPPMTSIRVSVLPSQCDACEENAKQGANHE